ncbi:RDD family protein [Faunimonas pinastri]|uniref:RDD family protein n=1 Tax=Faunimonas pinastri TaxID=1855383 RepID=A0A1H9JZT9_9HYPH|nr:RDD family protein [Faunimonas pinastri]SEQ92359.1 RDD family protein [Faunimonas pinastri]
MRQGARYFDIHLITIPLMFLFGLLVVKGWLPRPTEQGGYDRLLPFLVVALASLVNAVTLALFGNSLGKKILGLRAVAADGRTRLRLFNS